MSLPEIVAQIDQDKDRFRQLVNGDENATVVLESRTEKSIAGQIKERTDPLIASFEDEANGLITLATEQADRAEGQADRAEAIVDQSLICFEGAIFGYFNTYAAALAGLENIPNGAQVRIKEDENFGGATTEYFVTGPSTGESLVLDFLTDTYIIRELIFVRILQSPNIYLPPVTAPAAPSVGFILYVDEADGDLKAVSADNTVTTLASL